ncbi:MAG: hypothetical protein JJT77_13270 [Crocinitomicaceae bacterium]|nr:hypothetical protein [Crocinitomicaceae bacterium]
MQEWSQILNYSKDWKNNLPEIFLGSLINWLETKRHMDDSDENLNQLALTYNFIISFYLSEHYSQSKYTDTDKLEKGFWTTFELPNQNLFASFDLISRWVWWSTAAIEPYSFDLNVNPVFMGNRFWIEYLDVSKMDNWKKDGNRYFLNNLRYKKVGFEETHRLIKNQEVVFPNVRHEVDMENKIELIAITQSSLKLLSDLYLDEIKIHDTQIHKKDILQPLIDYSFKKTIRYERELDELRPKSNSWQWSYFQLNELYKVKDIECFPYFFMTKEKYISHNLQAASPEQKNVFNEIVCHFSYKITERYRFNRHRIGYDVWHTPFVVIDECLFCPMMFFARNEWFYSLAQVLLKEYDKNGDLRKSSSIKMEEGLLRLFKENNSQWNAFIPSFQHEGDIDIIVSDGSSDLFIQLKRTYFRTNLKDAHFESVNSDLKAINQLIKAEKFLTEHPEHYKLSASREKWLVSTSFERINEEFEDGAKKINYLELIWALRNKKFKHLTELKTYMYNDNILENSIL